MSTPSRCESSDVALGAKDKHGCAGSALFTLASPISHPAGIPPTFWTPVSVTLGLTSTSGSFIRPFTLRQFNTGAFTCLAFAHRQLGRDGHRHRLYGWDGAPKRGAVPSRHASSKMHERDGDGRPSTAIIMNGLAIMTTSRMPSTKVENAFATRNAHVHAIKSFSTMVETCSESKVYSGPLTRQFTPWNTFISGSAQRIDPPAAAPSICDGRPAFYGTVPQVLKNKTVDGRVFDGRARLRDGDHPYSWDSFDLGRTYRFFTRSFFFTSLALVMLKDLRHCDDGGSAALLPLTRPKRVKVLVSGGSGGGACGVATEKERRARAEREV
ncbi:hypothetical protein B0H16DRAFT_1789689 [Mycena metata]|uniref:Uncharacterized protein n=1 Tax=Mycena metata TaxID=1033252 RepID=A0AAD7MLL6_9AGAR|nr:hypothetical protein B0H16DRAFT_1789689 [Mycena metata]